MKVYLGRQPILDRGFNVIGYELLFSSEQEGAEREAGEAAPTSEAIANAVFGLGLDRLLNGKPAFINFDRNLLLSDWTTLLPPARSVIEISETVPPDEEVLTACARLQRRGYVLALDGCREEKRGTAFAPFVAFIKLDFQQTSLARQKQLTRYCRKLSISTVSKKLETEEDFLHAREMGYDYYQGYFFQRPTILATARPPDRQMAALRLLQQLRRDELNFPALEDLIEHDVCLSESFLRYANSAAFKWTVRIVTVHRGMTLLGVDAIRRWGWMAILLILGEKRPRILLTQALARGYFSEEIAGYTAMRPDIDPFLLGMFSLADSIIERPMSRILEDLGIGGSISNALMPAADDSDAPAIVLRLAQAFEIGDWDQVEAVSRSIGVSGEELNACYIRALSRVDEVNRSDDEKRRVH